VDRSESYERRLADPVLRTSHRTSGYGRLSDRSCRDC
jgi:hypothetical protein